MAAILAAGGTVLKSHGAGSPERGSIPSMKSPVLLGAATAATLLLTLILAALPLASAAPPADSAAAKGSAAATVRPTKSDLIMPEDLVKALNQPEAKRPLLVHVGFPTLYRSAHIAGSKYAGPCGKPEGRDSLTALLKNVPKNRAVVLYCGCCPWEHCPNVIPAFRIARSLGLKNVKVMYVGQDLQRDWVDRGLPALVH